jgi:hypothetical protein
MAASRTRWGHALVFALVLPLALSSALPTFARLVGGPAPHVCHCELRGGHTACGCPICHPDRDDLWLTGASLRGTCGDEDVVFGASLGFAILAAPGMMVVPADVTREAAPGELSRLSAVLLTPPTPPPRSTLV